jgi:hypothetical protein
VRGPLLEAILSAGGRPAVVWAVDLGGAGVVEGDGLLEDVEALATVQALCAVTDGRLDPAAEVGGPVDDVGEPLVGEVDDRAVDRRHRDASFGRDIARVEPADGVNLLTPSGRRFRVKTTATRGGRIALTVCNSAPEPRPRAEMGPAARTAANHCASRERGAGPS